MEIHETGPDPAIPSFIFYCNMGCHDCQVIKNYVINQRESHSGSNDTITVMDGDDLMISPGKAIDYSCTKVYNTNSHNAQCNHKKRRR